LPDVASMCLMTSVQDGELTSSWVVVVLLPFFVVACV